jgi:hypothetical protein
MAGGEEIIAMFTEKKREVETAANWIEDLCEQRLDLLP